MFQNNHINEAEIFYSEDESEDDEIKIFYSEDELVQIIIIIFFTAIQRARRALQMAEGHQPSAGARSRRP